MSTVVEYSKKRRELNYINNVIRTNLAKYYDSDWNIDLFYTLSDLVHYLQSNELLDVACIDVSEQLAIPVAESIRSNNRNAVILILADAGISPASYMKPSIMAASLLLFPLNEEQVKSAVGELFRYLSRETQDEASHKDVYVLKSKSEQEFIPYSKILFFEAREKKIFLNTAKREYGFYDTLEGVIEELPEYFVRCHRGFLVNAKKIKKVLLSQNIIELEDDVIVPLSKSYKPLIKELKKNGSI